MEMHVYQTLAFTTATVLKDQHERLQRGVLGILGEGGEIAEHVKKHIYHGHPLDRDLLFDELGDVLWYIAVLAHQMGFSLSDVAHYNLKKLEDRYKGGILTTELSLSRDPEHERRAAMEGRFDEAETKEEE